MATPSFEFEPFHRGLYSAEELLEGFDPTRPETYADMRDTRIYAEFIAGGGSATGDYLTAMTRALHDNGISQALADEIDSGNQRVVAIMGGHIGARGDAVYNDTARLAQKLAEATFTVASGGGPGIMEAAHLGAAFANQSGLEDALVEIAKGPKAIPDDAGKMVGADGKVDRTIAKALGEYLASAVRILRSHGKGGGLGIPTWMYGHEPTTPFASKIAKYFQNSIREDGLLALATNGVIYMQGGAGTLQEVFQDTAQNRYHSFPQGPGKSGEFSPMVFYGPFWNKMPVKPVLEALFGPPSKPPAPRNIGDEYVDWVRFLDNADDTVAHLQKFLAKPTPALHLISKSRRRPPAR
jgi:predicted Rossmann-fold nucleotide-binding protein